jgi:uncharacterized alpha/beta hydrolase family protein
LRFFIYDDLIVEISPLQSIRDTNSNKVSLKFNTIVKNFQFCDARCELLLVDGYSQETLSREILTPTSNMEFSRNYTVDLNMKGAGERIYYFYAICNNQKSFFCKTKEKKVYRTAISTIRRNYTATEFEQFQSLRTDLIDIHEELLAENGWQYEINKTIEAIGNFTNLEKKQVMSKLFPEFENALNLYYNQDFIDSRQVLQSLRIPSYESELQEIITKVNQFNKNVRAFTHVSNATYLDAYSFFKRTNNSKADLFGNYYAELQGLPQESFEDVSDYNVGYVFRDLNSLTAGYSSEKSGFESNMTAEMEQLAEVVSFSGLTGNLCEDLLALKNFTIEHNTTFNISEDYCTEVEPIISGNLTTLTEILVEFEDFPQNSLVIKEPNRSCCIYGKCSACSIEPDRYPIVFIHGHSTNTKDSPESSIKSLAKLQKYMSDDGLIVNAGDIDYNSLNSGYWSQMDVPVGVRATYYYISYHDAGGFSRVIRKEEGIESYSIRLKELIDAILLNTGADKVIIVAHSMGGLVSRNYLMLFGEDKVDKLILIGTPNNGVGKQLTQLCGYVGDNRACNDMNSEGVFMKKLSSYVPKIPVYTIIGTGCDTWGEDGDGIVQTNSSTLAYADNTYIEGHCDSVIGELLHRALLDPEKYPEAYERIKEIIWDG